MNRKLRSERATHLLRTTVRLMLLFILSTLMQPAFAATITSFSPASGRNGTEVTITGTNLVGPNNSGYSSTTTVRFAGVYGTPLVASPSTATSSSLTVTAPDGVRTGPLTVNVDTYNNTTAETINHKVTSTSSFTVAAVIDSFSPSKAEEGAYVEVHGNGFTKVTDVLFNGVSTGAGKIHILDDNQLYVYVPLGATTGKISVVTSDAGTAVSANNFIVGTNSSPNISEIPNQVTAFNTPKIISFTVNDDETAVGNLTLSASSDNTALVPTENIVFGGTGANRTVTITPATNQWGSNVILTLRVDDGNGSTNATFDRTFHLTIEPGNSGGSSITSFTPSNGTPGTVVSLIGTGFIGPQDSYSTTTIVYFKHNDGTWIGVSPHVGATHTSTSLKVTVPQGARTSKIVVDVSIYDESWQKTNTTAVSSNDFTVNAKIDSFSPTAATFGEQILIKGSGFRNVTDVLFNGVSAGNGNFSGDGSNGTEVHVYVPQGATTGKISIVTSDAGTAVSDTNFVVGANTLPIISDIANKTTFGNTSTGAIAFTVSDVETAPANLTVTATSSNTVLVPTTNIVFGGGAANRTVTITPWVNVSGTATITLIVSDTNGGTATDSFTVTVKDSIAPASVGVITPGQNSTIKTLSTISGTTADNMGGGGISKVIMLLRRFKSGTTTYQYWSKRNGVWGWGDSVSGFDTTLGAGDAWSVSNSSPEGTQLPSGANFLTGSYQFYARAYDQMGNVTTSSINKVTVDTSAPTSVAVTSPAHNIAIKGVTSISGIATDATGGSGIEKVMAYLRRFKSGSTTTYEYWAKRNGVWGWGDSNAGFDTVFSAGKWTVFKDSPAGTHLPSVEQLLTGSYQFYAIAFDKAGNYRISSVNKVTVDNVVPSSCVITSPGNDVTISSLSVIKGTATDVTGGSGTARVEAFLRRGASGSYEYWAKRDGDWNWGTSVIPIATVLNGRDWRVDNTAPAGTILPAGSTHLPPGTYQVFAKAFDKAENVLLSAIHRVAVAASPYAGKYNVNYATNANADFQSSGTFILNVSSTGDATANFTVEGLNRVAFNAQFQTSTPTGEVTSEGVIQMQKTVQGPAFEGSYQGHIIYDSGSEDAVTATIDATGKVTLQDIDTSTGGKIALVGSVNTATGAFAMNTTTPNGDRALGNGELVSDNGVLLYGFVDSAGVISASLSSTNNAHGDTFFGDLDYVASSPKKGSGTIRDTGLNNDGQGNGDTIANWTSIKQ